MLVSFESVLLGYTETFLNCFKFLWAMEGTIVNYRMGRHHQTGNQAVILVDGISSKDDTSKLIGKKVSFFCEGKLKKVISGKVSAPHGNSGAIRVLFDTGLPGQAIGKKIKLE